MIDICRCCCLFMCVFDYWCWHCYHCDANKALVFKCVSHQKCIKIPTSCQYHLLLLFLLLLLAISTIRLLFFFWSVSEAATKRRNPKFREAEKHRNARTVTKWFGSDDGGEELETVNFRHFLWPFLCHARKNFEKTSKWKLDNSVFSVDTLSALHIITIIIVIVIERWPIPLTDWHKCIYSVMCIYFPPTN